MQLAYLQCPQFFARSATNFQVDPAVNSKVKVNFTAKEIITAHALLSNLFTLPSINQSMFLFQKQAHNTHTHTHTHTHT